MAITILDEIVLTEQAAILIAGTTCLVLPALMAVYKATRETYPGFGLWVFGFISCGIGSLLLGANQFLPLWLSYWLGNVLIVLFPALLAVGFNVFIEQESHWRPYSLSVLLYALIQAVFLWFDVAVGIRTILFTLFVLTYVSLFTWGVYYRLPKLTGTRDYLTLSVTGISILIPVTRFVNTLGESLYRDPALFRQVDVLFIILLVLASVAMAFALITMNQQRLELDLRKVSNALSQKSEALAALNDKLRMASLTDFLTGLSNRRRFDQEYRRIWDLSLKNGSPLSLLLIDVDCFKLYNDSMGHLAGDECLQRIAGLLATLPSFKNALVARIGGEEFVVVLEKPLDDAIAQAEQLVSMVQHLAIPHPSSSAAQTVTISVGVATRGTKDSNASKLLSRADHALYHAKTAGRNRAKVA